MFRRILDYPFRGVPIAVDISGRNVHGTAKNVGFTADGSEIGSGAIVFGQPSSRVRVNDRARPRAPSAQRKLRHNPNA